ncbi:MAG: hypothetical protein OEU48_00100 [Gammaproteobacteria bacterium]|jgi:hypothetical protein|nr:hypothetical protein [Gammaproteobacteria bacterium]
MSPGSCLYRFILASILFTANASSQVLQANLEEDAKSQAVVAGKTPPADPGGEEKVKPPHPRESLTAQVGDPTAPLIQAQVTYLYSDVVSDSSDDLQQLLLQPLIPIPPTRLVPMTQIIRPTLAWLDLPDGKSGFGDIEIQHVVVPENHDWGTLGFGYTATWAQVNTRPVRR